MSSPLGMFPELPTTLEQTQLEVKQSISNLQLMESRSSGLTSFWVWSTTFWT